jgi:translation initiation factor 1
MADTDALTVGIEDIVFNQPELDNVGPAKGKTSAASVHIRLQQRNGRKCLTTIQGLPDDLDLKKILKYMRKKFKTNGTILKDEEHGEIVQLQGDQRKSGRDFLLQHNICQKPEVVVHGF